MPSSGCWQFLNCCCNQRLACCIPAAMGIRTRKLHQPHHIPSGTRSNWRGTGSLGITVVRIRILNTLSLKAWKSRPNQPKTCAAGPANCLVKSPPSDVQCGNSHDPPIPVHDAHQCPICQVVFAARTNTVVLQLPEPTGWISLAESWAVPVIDTAPRFELPSRGPPTA